MDAVSLPHSLSIALFRASNVVLKLPPTSSGGIARIRAIETAQVRRGYSGFTASIEYRLAARWLMKAGLNCWSFSVAEIK